MMMMGRALKLIMLVAAGVAASVRGGSSRNRESDGSDEDGSHKESGLKIMLWRTAKYFAVFLVVMAIGGFLLSASGIVPIKASSGHWAVTEWFLNFSSQRSVSTHTIGTEAPPLDEPRLVLMGAGAYETNCQACHGNPSLPQPRVAQGMTPRPPYLPSVLHQWDDAELFYIVKHGIKFTGMPAWPAQTREDEVWAMVAFLRALPRLDSETYQRLVRGDAPESGDVDPMPGMTGPEELPRAIRESCARCHGVNGAGRGLGAFPKLAGQSPEYLALSLKAYARGQRYSGVMEPNSVGLSDEEMRALALYYSRLPAQPPQPSSAGDAQAIERGEAIARNGLPSERIPACVSCHGPTSTPRNPVYPVLAGQYANYLVLQLKLFKNGQRGGTGYAHLMRSVAENLTPEQMRDVALYFQSLSGSPAQAKP